MKEASKETASVDCSMHSFTNPVIDLDHDVATSNWLMWIAVRYGAEDRQVYRSMDLTYRRTKDGWRIDTATVHVGAAIINGAGAR